MGCYATLGLIVITANSSSAAVTCPDSEARRHLQLVKSGSVHGHGFWCLVEAPATDTLFSSFSGRWSAVHLHFLIVTHRMQCVGCARWALSAFLRGMQARLGNELLHVAARLKIAMQRSRVGGSPDPSSNSGIPLCHCGLKLCTANCLLCSDELGVTNTPYLAPTRSGRSIMVTYLGAATQLLIEAVRFIFFLFLFLLFFFSANTEASPSHTILRSGM